MLTPRQDDILNLIVQLYRELEIPIGSKTLLKESILDVSPATVRNDMVALEKKGFILKAHTSSGRIPSYEGYRYYVNRLITDSNKKKVANHESDRKAVKELFRNQPNDLIKSAKMVADLFVSLTGYTGLVFGQSNEYHRIAEFKIIQLSNTSLINILITDLGHIESQVFHHPNYLLDNNQVYQISEMLNEELAGVLLEDAYQRLSFTLPLEIHKIVSAQLDFSPLVEKTIQQLKGHRYFVTGKNNLFDMLDSNTTPKDFKELFTHIDGSKELFNMFETSQDGIQILFGVDFSPESMHHLSLAVATFTQRVQKMSIALMGPSTMDFKRVIALMEQSLHEFTQ